jgi:hypothetical protein
MIKKTLWIINVVLWGLSAGVIVGAVASAVAASFSWLYIFGDNVRPVWVSWFILGTGAVVGVTTAGVVMRGVYVYSLTSMRRWEPYGGILCGILLWGGICALNVHFTEVERAQRAQDSQQLHFFERFLADKIRIAKVEVDRNEALQKIVVIVHFEGHRPGNYVLRWTVKEDLYHNLLTKGEVKLSFPLPNDAYRMELDMRDILSSYKEKATHGQGGYIVGEGTFILMAELEPQLTEEDRAAFPSEEVHNFELGYSQLITRAEAKIPGDFQIPGE